MKYDGAVIIDTRLDTESVPKDIEAVSGELGGLDSVLQKTKRAINDSMSKPVAASAAQIRKELDSCTKAIEKYRAEIQKAENDKLPEAEKANSMGAELDVEKARLAELQNQQQAAQQAMQFPEGRMMDSSEIEAYIEAKTRLPQISEEITQQQAKVDALEEKWNTACDKIDQYNLKINQAKQLLVANEQKAAELADELKEAEAAASELHKSTKQTSRELEKSAKTSDKIEESTKSTSKGMNTLGKNTRAFGSRLKSIALGALIFNTVSAGLREMTSYFGDVLKTNQSFTKELAKLKGALLTAFQPIYNVVTPVLSELIKVLTGAANAVAGFFAMITGTSVKENAKAAESLYNEANALNDVGSAAKEASRSMAGFDELNKLSDPNSGGSSSSATTPDFSGVSGEKMEIGDPLKDSLGELKGSFQRLIDVLKGDFQWVWINLLEPFGKWTVDKAAPAAIGAISSALDGLSATVSVISDAFQEVWPHIEPIVSWIGETVLVVLEDLKEIGDGIAKKWKENESKIKKTFENIGQVIEKIWAIVGPILTWIRDGLSQIAVDTPINDLQYIIDLLYGLSEILAGIFTLDIGQIFNGFGELVGAELDRAGNSLRTYAQAVGIDTDALDEKIGAWAEDVGQYFSDAWGKVEEVWGDVSSWFNDNVITPVQEAFAPIGEWFSELWGSIEQTFSDVFYNVGVIAEGCWETIQIAWKEAGKWVDENVIQPVSDFFSGLWTDISTWATDAWEDIKEAIQPFVTWVDENIIQPVSTFFSDLWGGIEQAAADAAKEIETAFNNIVQFFKDILNGIIYALNSALSWIFSGINSMLTDLKNFEIAGATPFSGIKTISVPQIPYLAQGAVLPANKPFMAVVGDQRHGTNVEAPLSTIQEAVALVMADQMGGMMAGFNAVTERQERILQAIFGLDISDGALAAAVQRHQDKMATVTGGIA